jgi:DNA ligase 1
MRPSLRGRFERYVERIVTATAAVMHADLLNFALVNDAAAGTASKLKKQATLATYFRSLADDDDLRRAVRFAAGRAFPTTSERVLNAGGRIVGDVLLAILKLDPGVFYEAVVKSGEIGEALSKLWPQAGGTGVPPVSPSSDGKDMGGTPMPRLTLADLSIAFDDLSSTGRAERKREILTELFNRCRHPREATYLAKIIFRDMRTGVQEGVLQAAVAGAFERPLAEIQRCQLLVGDLDEVAVLARHDRLPEARFKLFHPIQFMLATPQETARDAAATIEGRPFYVEDKLDGIRAQVHKSGDRIHIYTRTMDRTDESFPDVVEALRGIPGEFLLDGEIVPWRDGVVLPFAHIQKRLGRKTLSARTLRENPAAFIAFDILYRDAELLMDRPLRERRAALASLPALLSCAAIEVTTAEQIEQAFAGARARRNEGIVLKDPDSAYSPGRRGQTWLKLKTHLPTIDCVVTAAEYGHGKRRGVLSDYTFAVWDADPAAGGQLVNIGKAYSGCTDEEIARLTETFLSLSRGQHGHVHVVEPKIVLEIACDQIQKSGRHGSGFALRFPRIKRIRWDKRPEDADRLSRVVEIYESHANTARGHVTEDSQDAPEPTLFDGLA